MTKQKITQKPIDPAYLKATKALIYHSADVDGLMAGYLMSIVYHQEIYDGMAVLIGYNYGKSADWMYSEFNEIIFVDVTPPIEWMQFNKPLMSKGLLEIKIYDHHKNRIAEILNHFDEVKFKDSLKIRFDEYASGSMIYFTNHTKYFVNNPTVSTSDNYFDVLDLMVNFVSDYDTWTFAKNPETSYNQDVLMFNECMFQYKDLGKFCDVIKHILQSKVPISTLGVYLTIGDTIINYKKTLNVEMIKNCYYLPEHMTIVYEGTPNFWFYEQAKEKYPELLVWIGFKLKLNTDDVRFSLRSHVDSHIDVSEIAQNFGGNGHFNAAGFSVSLNLGTELIKDPEKIFDSNAYT